MEEDWMGLIPIGDRARQERRLLESLACLPTHGVRVEIVDDGNPCCDGQGVVSLPKTLFEPGQERKLILAWNHELRHALDVRLYVNWREISLQGEDFERLKDRLEERAYRAEVNTGLAIDPHWRLDFDI